MPKAYKMTTLSISRLAISWAVSRGRDTYGYNICRLDDVRTGQRFRTCGGGYDMVGTVLGDWLEDVKHSELMTLIGNNPELAYYDSIDSKRLETPTRPNALYGVYAYYKDGKLVEVKVDGGCGVNSVQRVIEVLGYTFESVYNKRKQTTTDYIISKEIN